MNYRDKLKNPRWQRKRLKILERDGFQCRICRCKDQELHVHHAVYVRDAQPWEVPDDYLFSVCRTHHEELQELRNQVSLAMCQNRDAMESITALVRIIELQDTGAFVGIQCVLDYLSEKPDRILPMARKIPMKEGRFV